MNETMTQETPKTALKDPKSAMRKVRAWLLKAHPEERTMIGEFRKDVTFAEINKRMHEGEDFYLIADCGESVQREYVFAELARIYKTDYDYWYRLWLESASTRLAETCTGVNR